MNNYLYIKINTSSALKTIKLLNRLNINLYHIKIKNDILIIKIKENDLKRISKVFDIEIIRYTGIKRIKEKIKNNKLFIYILILFIIILFILSKVTNEVNIIHSNPEIRNLISTELELYNIGNLNFKKSYSYLEEVKSKILTKYNDQIEWLEIINDGLNYTVKVQEKTSTPIKEPTGTCDVVANKDATITRIITTSGENIKEVNQNVKEGEIIVSGTIMAGEEIKEEVCASAIVYGETWYTISISMPKEQTIKTYTGQERINFSINSNDTRTIILNSRLEIYDMKFEELFTIGEYSFNIIKEQEYTTKKVLLTDQEILDKVEKEIENKVKTLLKEDYQIIDQKVLKKTINNSTIDIETFIIVEERIDLQITTNKLEETE